MNKAAANIFSAISDYVNAKSSWMLTATYKMDQPQLVESHTNKETPQYEFNKEIKEFGNDGRKATKQELYKNLLRMDAVTMMKPEHLEKDL